MSPCTFSLYYLSRLDVLLVFYSRVFFVLLPVCVCVCVCVCVTYVVSSVGYLRVVIFVLSVFLSSVFHIYVTDVLSPCYILSPRFVIVYSTNCYLCLSPSLITE